MSVRGAVCCECACLTGLVWCVVAVAKNGSNTSGVYRFKLQEGRFVFLQTKSKLFYNHATQAPEYILSTHSIIRSVHPVHTLHRQVSTSCRHTPSSGQYVLSTHSIVRSVRPVDTLHRQVSTSCRHTPSSGQYILSTHSIVRSVHPVDTLHHQVSTSCRHTPSSGQYSSFHVPSLGQHSLSTHSIRSGHLFLFFSPRSIVRSVHLVNAPSAGQYILSTHSSIRSVHLIFSRLVDILHHQVSTPCRHTPSSGQYSLSRHSMIKSVHPVDTSIVRSVHLIFSRSIVRSRCISCTRSCTLGKYISSPLSIIGSEHLIFTCHGCVGTVHLHTPSSGQYISSSHAMAVWVLYIFTLHDQGKTSHLHMPWLCGYCRSSHSIVRSVHQGVTLGWTQ